MSYSGDPDYYRYLYSNTLPETRFTDPFRDDEYEYAVSHPRIEFDNPFRDDDDEAELDARNSFHNVMPSPLGGSWRSGPQSWAQYDIRVPPPVWVQEEQERDRRLEEMERAREEGMRRRESSVDEGPLAPLSSIDVMLPQHRPTESATTESSHPSMEEMDMNFGLAPIQEERGRSRISIAVKEPPRAARATNTHKHRPATARHSSRRPSMRQRSSSVFSTYMGRMSGFRHLRGSDSRRKSSCNNPAFYFGRAMTKDGLDIPIFETELAPEVAEEFMKKIKKEYDASMRVKYPIIEKYIFPWFWYFLTAFLFWFLMIGLPIWPGAFYGLYLFFKNDKTHITMGCLIFLFWGTWTCFLPMIFTRFEPDPTDAEVEARDASTTALIIPAYKAAGALPATIECALKIFKPEQIFVVANGNSPTPLDETADVCLKYRVNHTWVPVGSKIAAEFVGVALAKQYEYILLIDDDVHLPPNFPLPIERMQKSHQDKWWKRGMAQTACIGYTIHSTGANGSIGTVWQQAQDLEYKLAGMTRVFAGNFGSSTFPHGACILWDRKILMGLFGAHPGYAISEDWYFGHISRGLGHRIQFCSQVFVETETPTNFLFPDKGSGRGGYGEMTVWKQRFYRWNFFHVYRLWDNMVYLLFAWRLGRLEIVTKYCVFVEIYDSLSFILRPIIFPVAMVTSPKLSVIITAATIVMYCLGSLTFNAFILGKKKAGVRYGMLPHYFWMKFILNFINSASVFYAWWMYGTYFNKKHPKVVENYIALEAAKTCIAAKLGEQVQQELKAEGDKTVAIIKPTEVARVAWRASAQLGEAIGTIAEAAKEKAGSWSWRERNGSVSSLNRRDSSSADNYQERKGSTGSWSNWGGTSRKGPTGSQAPILDEAAGEMASPIGKSRPQWKRRSAGSGVGALARTPEVPEQREMKVIPRYGFPKGS